MCFAWATVREQRVEYIKRGFIYSFHIPFIDSRLYPKEVKSLGDLIRRIRIEKGLEIKQLANLVGANPTSVGNWGIHSRTPEYPYLRKIEYVLNITLPASLIFKNYPDEPTTLAEKIKQKRLDMKLSFREFAKMLEVGIDAVKNWEHGRARPCKSYLEKIKRYCV